MKNYLLLILAMFAIQNLLNGQFSILVESGLSNGQTQAFVPGESESRSNSTISSYYASIKPRINIKEHLSIALELQYAKEGYQTLPPSSSAKQELDYFRLVPQAELKLWDGIRLVGGGYLGYLQREQFVWRETDFISCPIYGSFQGFEVGVMSGLSFTYNRLYLTCKYNLGLNSFSREHILPSPTRRIEFIETRARFVQLGIGYVFGSRY